jgi:hypothetical protein
MGKNATGTATIESIKPYVERALKDPEFRRDLKDAIDAAKQLYGPLSKSDGIADAATKLTTDKKTQKHLQKALDDVGKAAGSLKGKKKSHKGRNTLLLAGVVAGALYNPWTGPQTRKWILDKVAGDDDLQPLDGFDLPATNGGSDYGAGDLSDSFGDTASAAAEEASAAAETAKDTIEDAADTKKKS